MVINFRARGINRGTHKLTKYHINNFFFKIDVVQILMSKGMCVETKTDGGFYSRCW
jgi:hypothetical protein